MNSIPPVFWGVLTLVCAVPAVFYSVRFAKSGDDDMPGVGAMLFCSLTWVNFMMLIKALGWIL